MIKRVIALGRAVGVIVCYGIRISVYSFFRKIYGVFQKYRSNKDNKKMIHKEEDLFEKKTKKNEDTARKFKELIANRSYVDLLTSKELTAWFRENRPQYAGNNMKMLIVIPTEEHMKGLGYSVDEELDTDTNIVQLFYDDKTGKLLKIRLVSYTDIESNLQAELIEQEGMIVVID